MDPDNDATSPELDLEAIGPALGKLPSGVYILTAMHRGERLGMLASFVEQAGFDPPAISVAVSKGRRIAEAIDETGLFGVNVLAEDDGSLMKPFAQSDNASPFDGIELADGDGPPQILESLAFLSCRRIGEVDCGDHTLYAAEVLGGELHDGRKPMVRIRKNGFQY